MRAIGERSFVPDLHCGNDLLCYPYHPSGKLQGVRQCHILSRNWFMGSTLWSIDFLDDVIDFDKNLLFAFQGETSRRFLNHTK